MAKPITLGKVIFGTCSLFLIYAGGYDLVSSNLGLGDLLKEKEQQELNINFLRDIVKNYSSNKVLDFHYKNREISDLTQDSAKTRNNLDSLYSKESEIRKTSLLSWLYYIKK